MADPTSPPPPPPPPLMVAFQALLAHQGICSGNSLLVKELVPFEVADSVCCADVDAEILHRDLWAAFDHGPQF